MIISKVSVSRLRLDWIDMWSNYIWWHSTTELRNDDIKNVLNKSNDQGGAGIVEWGWLNVCLRWFLWSGFIRMIGSTQRKPEWS